MRSSPGGHGKTCSERTIQKYARSARAFFHWLVCRETIERNPFDHVTFPRVGKLLIQTIDAEEFERLLLAYAPPNETGPIAERAAVRNRAILWVLYDTGIRVSELCWLRLADFDRRHGILTDMGIGSKERSIAQGNNCLRNLLYYLDKHRPDDEKLADWGIAGENHLFLSETRLALLTVINIDKHAASPKAEAFLKVAGTLPESVEPRQVKYLNTLVEQDHRSIKRLVKPAMGFFSFQTAWRTLQGEESMHKSMHMIRKGQMRGAGK